MNFKYSALVLATLFALSYGQNDNELKAYLQKFENISTMVCNPSKPLTDDQVLKINTTCQCNKDTEEQVNKLIMACLNITTAMTPKQKISAFCAPAKECMVKSWTAIIQKLKPAEVGVASATMDKYGTCIKTSIS